MILWLSLGWLVGCGRTPEPVPTTRAPVTVQAVLERPPEGGGGVLVVRVEHDQDLDVELPTPVASGLEFELLAPPTIEVLGESNLVTQRFRFSGSRGHYEVQPLEVAYPGPDGQPATAASDALFLDLGTDPVRSDEEMADIVESSDPRGGYGWLIGGIVGVLVAVGFAFWPRRQTQEVAKRPPLPPHLAALHAWEAVRADPERSDEEKARELSVIFRRYVEAVLRFEATAATTKEIVDHLQGLARLPEGNVPRAKRLLRATDRIKFAEERPTDELVAELDADLRAFVDATRPSQVRSA